MDGLRIVCAVLIAHTFFVYVMALDDAHRAVLLDAGAVDKELNYIQSWMTVVEACAWLTIVALVEIMLQLESTGVSGGALIRSCSIVKFCSYAIVVVLASGWAWMDYPMYLWDNMLWIFGFLAIDRNLSRWRRELRGDTGT